VEDLTDTIGWLTTAEHYWGTNGIVLRIWEHLQYSALAVLIAVLVAAPLGLLIGHTGRGESATFLLSGAARAVPTLGLLILAYSRYPLELLPVILVLVVLAIPPVLANTAAGIAAVDAGARDAAKGMGMKPLQVLSRVEVPLALPLILAGVRSAALQVIATATIAAYAGLGGLGQFIFRGFNNRDYPQAFGGSVIVALLALASELAFSALQRRVTPREERGKLATTIPATVPVPQAP
jgi:osmoprotectant transport system permease protein